LIIDDSKNHTRPAERTNGSTSNHLTPKAPYKPDPKVCWVKCAVVAHGYGANRDGERRCGRRSTVDLSADGNGHPSDLRDAEWAARTADPPGVGGSVTAQDRYARGDERHLLFANALASPGAICPARPSTTLFAGSGVMASGRRSRPELQMGVVVHPAAIQDRDGAGLVLGRRRLQRMGKLRRGDKGATAARRDRQTEQRHEGLRGPAAPLGRRAHLLLVRPNPASRQGLREPSLNPGQLGYPRFDPAGSQAACHGVDRNSTNQRFAPHDGEGLQIGW